ncbi:MAG: DUF1631 family protein [Rubrivivax sp.]
MPSAPSSAALRLQLHSDVAAWVTPAVRDAVQELSVASQGADAPPDNGAAHEVLAVMARRETSFAAHLAATIRARLVEHEEMLTDTGVMPLLPAGPDLVTAEAVDETIELARVVNDIEWHAEHPLADLVARASCLAGQREPNPRANPLSPATIGRALMRSVRSLGLPPPARRCWMAAVGQAMARRLPEVYRRHARWLEEAGVGALADGHALASGWGEPGRVRQPTPQQALQQLVAWGQQMSARVVPGDGLRILDEPVSLRARDDIMDLLFNHLRAQMAAKPTVQVMITRLQTSARRVAAADPSLWRSLDHPLWKLIERILSTATATALDEPAVKDLHAAIERTLQTLTGGAALDAERWRAEVDQLEFAVTGVMLESGDRLVPEAAGLQAKAAKAEWTERLREQLQLHVQQAAATRAPSASAGVTAALPPAVHRFLMETWVEVLYSASHSGGPALAQRAALVDDLIACAARAPGTALPEPQLRSLMLRVREGLQAASLSQVQQDSALRALMPALQRPHATPRKAPAASPAPAPAVSWPNPAGPVQTDLGALHAALPTVPIGIVDGSEHSQRADADCRRWLEGLRVGDRLRIHLDAAWTTAHVRWRSADASVFVLIPLERQGQHSFTRRALESLRKAGLVATLERGELLAKVFASLMGGPASALWLPPAPASRAGKAGASRPGRSLTDGITVAR